MILDRAEQALADLIKFILTVVTVSALIYGMFVVVCGRRRP